MNVVGRLTILFMFEIGAILLEALGRLASMMVRFFAGRHDRIRIAAFFEERGVQLRKICWSPFATGHMTHWRDRFYRVEYDDPNGKIANTLCRTSRRTGVVVTDEEL